MVFSTLQIDFPLDIPVFKFLVDIRAAKVTLFRCSDKYQRHKKVNND
jgi:hypothetical protein